MTHFKRSTRRHVLRMGAAAGAGLLVPYRDALALDTPGRLGVPLGPYGERSPFEKAVRWRRESKTPETGSSFTPIQDSVGTLTPSSLHYERHHSGIPAIDPAQHRLVIHGMVERPLSLSMEDIRRLPSVTRTLVLECGGNSGSEWADKTGVDVQRSYGLVSGSEWTGVPLSLLLAEVGVRPGASWVIAEGADACRMERSIPLSKAMDNSLLAYGQNGEAIRPAQGYPLRLINPGWEGNTNVKWLHSLKLTNQAYMARDETAKYTELMPDGKAWMFTYEMDAKSVITFPSGGQTLPGRGPYELTGLAWSGRGTNRACRSDARRRAQLGERAPPGAAAPHSADAFPPAVAVRRARGHDRVTRDRRHRVCAADARSLDCGAGDEFELSLQRDQVLDCASRRDGDQCGRVASSCCGWPAPFRWPRSRPPMGSGDRRRRRRSAR